jgi:hypothetical protein
VQSLVSAYQKAGTNPILSVEDKSAIYISCLAANLVNAKNLRFSSGTLTTYLGFRTQTSEPLSISRGWVVRSVSEDSGDDADLNDEEEGEDLCNSQFSPAYDAQILFNTATLYLKHKQAPLRSPLQEWYWKAAQQKHRDACFALMAWYLVGSPGILPQPDVRLGRNTPQT